MQLYSSYKYPGLGVQATLVTSSFWRGRWSWKDAAISNVTTWCHCSSKLPNITEASLPMTSASQSAAGAAATPSPASNATTPRPTSGEWWRPWANVDVESASVFWMTCCTQWEATTARPTWTLWRGETLRQLHFIVTCRLPFEYANVIWSENHALCFSFCLPFQIWS